MTPAANGLSGHGLSGHGLSAQGPSAYGLSAHSGPVGGESRDPIRVVLVDDQELVRAGFALILGSSSDLQVVGQAAGGEEALELLARQPADVVLMDIRMPGLDGVATTSRLLERPHPPRVVMLTTFDEDELLVAALRAGASGYLVKDSGPAELIAAVRAAAAGEAPVSPRLTMRLIDSFVRRSTPPVPDQALGKLTAREREILAAIGLGLTNPEIAARLHVAESTVKTHVGAVLRKLDLRDRVQAVIVAQSLGPPPPA